MVLSCISLLVLALMMAMGFSLSNAIHEKVRLQSHADATAFSAATIAARAMNVTAYTNRAIAAVLVTQMSVHAWMAIANQTISIDLAVAKNLKDMKDMEDAKFCEIVCWGDCCYFPHNIHGMIDGIAAGYAGIMAIIQTMTVAGKESEFNDTVAALNDATTTLHAVQMDALNAAKTEISSESTVLGALKSRNAPHSDYTLPVLRLNAGEFACALEGTSFDGECSKVHGSVPTKASQGVRSAIMQNAANAARLLFHSCGDCSASSHSDFKSGASSILDLQFGDDDENHDYSVMASVSNRSPMNVMSTSEEAKAVGANSMGNLTSSKYCFDSTSSLMAMVWSGESGGWHWNLLAHRSSHDKFKGYQQEDVCEDGACFVNFRSSSDKDIDFNQPSMYAGVKQILERNRTHNMHRPWEINANGAVGLNLGNGLNATLDIKPRGWGVAVSKAKVYYHQLGHWQFQPNLFDPFWRAKLHPFKRDEMQTVLTKSGDTEAASIVGGGGPVEGDDP